MSPAAHIVINKRTGECRVLSRAALDAFDFGPDPSVWRVC